MFQYQKVFEYFSVSSDNLSSITANRSHHQRVLFSTISAITPNALSDATQPVTPSCCLTCVPCAFSFKGAWKSCFIQLRFWKRIVFLTFSSLALGPDTPTNRLYWRCCWEPTKIYFMQLLINAECCCDRLCRSVAGICLHSFAVALRLGGAEPTCTHLQLIQSSSAPSPAQLKRPVHSSTPLQFVFDLPLWLFGSWNLCFWILACCVCVNWLSHLHFLVPLPTSFLQCLTSSTTCRKFCCFLFNKQLLCCFRIHFKLLLIFEAINATQTVSSFIYYLR